MQISRILHVLVFILLSFKSFATQDFFRNIRAVYPDQEFRLDPSNIFTLSSKDTLTFEDILAAPESAFTRLDKTEKFNNEDFVWAYIQLKNEMDASLELVLEGGRNSQEIYYIISDSTTIRKKTGYFIASSQRDIARGYSTKIKIEFEPRELVKVYVRYISRDNLPIDIKFRGITAENWENKQKQLILFEGIFTGVILLILTLNGFIYGFTKERIFFYFGTYATCNLVYFLHIHGFVEILIFPNSPNTFSWLWLMPFLTVGFYFLFTKEFLELDDENPFLSKVTNLIGKGSILLFFAFSVFLFLPIIFI